jgi:hypothetical protein
MTRPVLGGFGSMCRGHTRRDATQNADGTWTYISHIRWNLPKRGCAMAADRRELAALEHANLIESFAMIASGFPARQFNQILVERDGATADALVDVIAFGRSRPAPWVLHLREGIDDEVATMAADMGLVRSSPEPTMPGLALADARGAMRRARPMSAGLKIVRAADDTVIGDHARVMAEVFKMPEEAARRRGHGEAITRRVIADGLADVASVAVLQSSTMGRLVYERIGFELVVEYSGWVETAR